MSDEVERQVLALEAMDLEALRREWRVRYGSPPKLRSVPFLRLALAWRIQADAYGGLDTDTLRRLRGKGRVQAEGLELGTGARLRREWQGRIIEVEVEERGFRFDGKVYKSLSAIATEVAGSRWNGPRFFGLREAKR
jgi:hypothetical protein